MAGLSGMIGSLAKKAGGSRGKKAGLGGAMASVSRKVQGKSRAGKMGAGAGAGVGGGRTGAVKAPKGTFQKMKARFQGRNSMGSEGGY